jgi:hypothetical protein
MEPIEVTVSFNITGQITPLKFIWKGQTYPVDATGRRWIDERGQHFLVMVPGERIYELLFDPVELRWHLFNTVTRSSVV